MNQSEVQFVWLFHASGARFAGGVFKDASSATAWIEKHELTGVLTAYPFGEGCFDWAVRSGKTSMSAGKLMEKSSDPSFVGGFSSAAQEHFHFEKGRKV